MGKLKFIIGGARSGKSRFAAETAKKTAGKVAFVATSQALDEEMGKRIQLHKGERPPTWQTFEEFKDIAPLIKKIGNLFDTVIIDCLTLYISNLLLEGVEDKTIEKGISSLIEAIKQIKSDVLIVSNEVGLGVVPDNQLARHFRDLAGKINQLVASQSDEVIFIASGIPMVLKRREKMDKIKETIAKITDTDSPLMENTQQHLDNLTKPQGSLGRLEELAKLVVGITQKEAPSLKNKVIFTLAADHGVAAEGVSAFPQEVTAQMVYNFINEGAGINVLANHTGAKVIVADVGVAEELKIQNAKLKIKKIGYGTKNMISEPAMSREEGIKSIETGIELFQEEFSEGIDIVGTGEMGIANTTASSAICAVITGEPIEDVTGRGTGIDEAGLSNKIKVIRKAIQLHQPDPKDALDVLSKVGGFEIGGLAGIILAAASKKIPIVIDGFISGAAALIAYTLAPKVKDYMIAAHCSVERGHRIILEHIGLKPLLDLNLRLGEGTGAALAMNVIEAGVKILNEMATFKNAGVSEKEEKKEVTT